MEPTSAETSPVGTAFRGLQQGNACGYDYTECADDFHGLILRLNALSGNRAFDPG